MQNELLPQAEKYAKKRRRHRTWEKIVGSLACLVVFVTTYMLILPAITMEQTAYCGVEAHQHSDACYETRLICTDEEPAEAGHIHTDVCYEEQQSLVCEQEETPGHSHGEDCIQTQQALTCAEDHEHTDDCYETVVAIICEMTEGEGAHTHGPDCFETQQILICDVQETAVEEPAEETHAHTDACYEKVLICPLEEHEHSLACYANYDADLESASVWERSISGTDLTGNWADDLITVAQTQLGYTESTRNYIVSDTGEMKGITRYGQWYGDAYGDWCAMFVSFCLNYAGIPGTAMPYESSCVRWINLLSGPEIDRFEGADTYTPVKGDLIFFDMDGDSISDHVGIIAEVTEDADAQSDKLKVVEGNSADCVQYVSYDRNDWRIFGYGRLPANPDLPAAEERPDEEEQQEDGFILTAAADNGVTVRLSGPESSLPFPADEITITVETISNENAVSLVDAAVADTELENGQLYLFDVRLWHDGQEIEPCGPVVLSFEGVASPGEGGTAGVFHVDEENAQATDMNAELTEAGSVVVDTDHFSLYAVMVAEGGNVTINQNITAIWDEQTTSISGLTFTVSSGTDKMTYQVEYSDNDGESWNVVSISAQTSKNTPVDLNAFDALTDAPLTRLYRIYGAKDKNNYGFTASVTLYDILDSIKSGFSQWLENSYVQDFGGTALPTTTQELYQAFAVYYALPTLTIESRMDSGNMFVDAQTDGAGTYTYAWEYRDEEGNWVSLCEDTTATINASSIELLLDGGKDIRCKLYESGQLKAISNTLFVNPLREVYDAAIAEINTGLNLGALAIYGTRFTDYFYYGNVAKDSRVPFSDAQSYADYLAKLYLDKGGSEAGLAAVRSEWNKYLYDLYDPSLDNGTKQNINGGYPGNGFTYGDIGLGWEKDQATSFHGTLSPEIDPLNYNFLEGGVDYSNFVSGLDKTATAVAPGDENTERKYDIDITADAQAKARGPVAMILQIQTSWQMFDLEHANAVTGQGYTEVGALAQNTELATLYDIKQALLRFVDYMETYYPGNNLVLGITEVQHAGSQTMFSGTDGSGKSLYVTNNYEILRQSIRNWDSFGNCEHVHYDTNALVNATTNLSSNLANWKDFYGEIIQYNDIQKVAVIIGGPTENTNSTNGYGCTLPWATFQKAGLNSVYSIRTNNGTPTNAAGVLSWLDNTANNTGAAFCDGTGTSFTEKYVATSEDAVFNYLVQIAEKEMQKKGIDIKAEDKYVEDVEVSDTVSDEFVLDTTEPVTATVYNKDGSVAEQKTLQLDDPNLTITANPDGTTTITYNFGTVYNTKKCVLHFRVQAREDYIGSNNVYSNLGTPALGYVHEKLDHLGNPTGVEDRYRVNCYDTPQVNVPIRFTTVDGDTASIIVGESVDLADLSTAIAQNAEDLVDNYDQINGSLSYTWVLPDGTERDAGSVTVTKGSIGEQSFPSRSSVFEGTAAGQYTGTLKVTFTPETVDSGNRNFSNADTAVAVNLLTKPGNVWINVVSADSTERFFVRKEWVGDPPEGTDSVTFRVLANGIAVTGEDGQPLVYALSAGKGWETEVSGLPSVKDGVIQNYTVEELDRPSGYLDTYRSESRVENDYAAKVTLSFTPSAKKDNVILKITYTYNGEERTYTVPTKTTYKNGETYSFVVEDLPLDENGDPYHCEIISIVNTNDKNNPLAVSTSSATAEKYLRGSVSTEVKVITNTPAYELPSTGGPGAALYAAGGLLLTLSAGLLLLYKHFKRRKEDLSSS